MRPAPYTKRIQSGYTLIELLVVIAIIAILSVVGFVSINNFSSTQALKKAAGEIQSFLRLAQSNATSSTLCKENSYGSSWTIKFVDSSNIDLICLFTTLANPIPSEYIYKTLTLQSGVTINTITALTCTLSLPVMIIYSALKGVPIVSNSDHISTDHNDTCLGGGQEININLTNSSGTKVVNFTSGGAINVQ